MPAELSTRVTFMAHDFITEQPVKGADAYLFRWVFHNWSDKYCLQILRNLIPALKDGARIIVQDNCLPEPNTISYTEEAKIRCVTYFFFFRFCLVIKVKINWMYFLHRHLSNLLTRSYFGYYRLMDLTILELQNAREREIDDWAGLFKQADAQFYFLGGKQPTGSNLWIIEAVWEADKLAI